MGNAGGEPQLRHAEQEQEEFAAADHGALDAWRTNSQLRRRSGVRSRGSHRFQQVSAALVRSLAEGGRRWRRSRAAGADFCDGRWRCAQNSGGADFCWRALARGEGMAASTDRGNHLLPAREWSSFDTESGKRDAEFV